MGLRDASAPFSGQRQLCGAASGARGLAAGRSTSREPNRDANTASRDSLRETSSERRGTSRDAGAASRRPVRDAETALSRAAARLLLLGVRFYQIMLAPLMFSACKFYPSCSHYAAEAIERHGAWHGLRLAAGRLLRCRPFTQGGHDPVPDVLESDVLEDDSMRRAHE
jgi:putative membrane protein insertion efficiency factor